MEGSERAHIDETRSFETSEGGEAVESGGDEEKPDEEKPDEEKADEADEEKGSE